jgi:hypothetical protein
MLGHICSPEFLMSAPKTLTALRTSLATCVISLAMGTGAGFAADTPPQAHPAQSKEMREKMATMHDQMAACLRSDSSVKTCHEKMMKTCHETMGETDCPMMGMHEHPMKDHPMGTMAPK